MTKKKHNFFRIQNVILNEYKACGGNGTKVKIFTAKVALIKSKAQYLQYQ